MKNSTLKHVIILMAICISISLNAQTVTFRYDNSGNRTSRDIIVKKSTSNNNSETKQVTNQVDILGDVKITISPNPNGGRFSVKIEGCNLETSYQLQLFSANGKLVYEDYTKELINEIDISKQENGIYILSLIMGETKKTWKIIKQ